jgi:hypothetical protein
MEPRLLSTNKIGGGKKWAILTCFGEVTKRDSDFRRKLQFRLVELSGRKRIQMWHITTNNAISHSNIPLIKP